MSFWRKKFEVVMEITMKNNLSCDVMYVGRQGSAVLRKVGTVSVYLTERRHIS